MRMHCNFATMAGLTDSLHAAKHWGSEKVMQAF